MEQITLKDNHGTSYLNECELDRLISKAKEIRKGHKLNPLALHRFLVYVDGECFGLNRYDSLRALISTCLVSRADFRMFRNADKGVTVLLEKTL
jgi:hypothetical protein